MSASVDGRKLTDPSVIASLAWTEAHIATAACCLRQQEIEIQLFNDVVGRKGIFETSAGRLRSLDSIWQAYMQAKIAETNAVQHEEELLDQLAQTRATSLAGVAAKLSVIVREAEDNTDLSDFPIDHVRSAVEDIHRLMDQSTIEQLPLAVGISPDDFVQPSLSLAAWCAFHAWSQHDDKRYRIWTTAFKALTAL